MAASLIALELWVFFFHFCSFIIPSWQSSVPVLGCKEAEAGAQLRLVFRLMLLQRRPTLTRLAGKMEKHQGMAAHIAVDIYY